MRQLLLVLASCPESLGQEQTLTAPKEYLGRQIATTMHFAGAPWLVRESREREEDCRRLLDALQLKPGQSVCDLGCGNGFYTLRLAQIVGPQGRVYAVDIQPEMLGLLRTRAELAGLKNIELVLGTENDPRLPDKNVDLALLVDVYHEFSRPEEMLAAIQKSLTPTGRIALAEFRGEDPDVPIKPLHKMTKEQILREYSHNGLSLAGEYNQLPWQHLMFFQTAAREKSPESE